MQWPSAVVINTPKSECNLIELQFCGSYNCFADFFFLYFTRVSTQCVCVCAVLRLIGSLKQRPFEFQWREKEEKKCAKKSARNPRARDQ